VARRGWNDVRLGVRRKGRGSGVAQGAYLARVAHESQILDADVAMTDCSLLIAVTTSLVVGKPANLGGERMGVTLGRGERTYGSHMPEDYRPTWLDTYAGNGV
jgi:hypothetical protein